VSDGGSPPNALLSFILVGGVVLQVTENLTTWWGIAIIVAAVLVAAAAEIQTYLIPAAESWSDALLVTPAAGAGVYLGHSIFDTWWGVVIGVIGCGLVAAIPAAFLQTFLERRGV